MSVKLQGLGSGDMTVDYILHRIDLLAALADAMTNVQKRNSRIEWV